MPRSFENAFSGKTVWVTGHTGFTGSWTCLWLTAIGAWVRGFALPPDTEPSLFVAADAGRDVETAYGDVTDAEAVHRAMADAAPDLVLHLAAQPLVRRSYREPLRTFAVNALGTAHVLDAAWRVPSVRGVLCVTTDKVYRNDGSGRAFREDDPLGGSDPYSASKAAAEMAVAGYRRVPAAHGGDAPRLAVARGGNIVGGGDWAEDRLVPDFVRAATSGAPLTIRYPDATRPWQHVLGLVEGYLRILARLAGPPEMADAAARAWNLGPSDPAPVTVRDALERLATAWVRPDLRYERHAPPESAALSLDSGAAREALGWRPAWDTDRVFAETAAWYRDYYAAPETARALTLGQLAAWREAMLVRRPPYDRGSFKNYMDGVPNPRR